MQILHKFISTMWQSWKIKSDAMTDSHTHTKSSNGGVQMLEQWLNTIQEMSIYTVWLQEVMSQEVESREMLRSLMMS